MSKASAIAYRKLMAKRLEYEDAYGNKVPKGKLPLEQPNHRELSEIHRVLSLLSREGLPRCKYREWRTAVGLDKELGYSKDQIFDEADGFHTKLGHVCAECRCTHIAGWGTRGWWYWPEDNEGGFGEVGHYGVGPCYNHGPYSKIYVGTHWLEDYSGMIHKEIRAMRNSGMAPDIAGGRWLQMKEEMKLSEERVDLRVGCRMMLDNTRRVIDYLSTYKASDRDMEKCYAAILEVFGAEPDWLDAKDWAKLKKALTYRPFTESYRGECVPMSDEKAARLAKDLIAATSKEMRQVLEVSQDDYYHKDDVRSFTMQILTSVERIYKGLGTEENWSELQQALLEAGNEIERKRGMK